MDEIDIGLFDRDWNNTLYYFILNADEQIYLRYGGRDSKAPDSYLDLNSLERALERGLELHQQYREGKLPKRERPKALFPREIPLLVERTLTRSACVECHLIGDFQNLQREQAGTLDKLKHLYRSPDLTTLGIHLDVPKGLVVKDASGAVKAAGLQAGDRISAFNGLAVWTFGDLQYELDRISRDAKSVRLSVERGSEVHEFAIELPERWWWTDLTFRQWSVEPRVYFDSRPLSEAEKVQHALNKSGFASEVTHVDMFAEMMKSHQLRVGDVIIAIDGVDQDAVANTAELYIKLRKSAGSTVTLNVLRGGQRMEMPLKTYRLSFRK
jgi:hypothetical protein